MTGDSRMTKQDPHDAADIGCECRPVAECDASWNNESCIHVNGMDRTGVAITGCIPAFPIPYVKDKSAAISSAATLPNTAVPTIEEQRFWTVPPAAWRLPAATKTIRFVKRKT